MAKLKDLCVVVGSYTTKDGVEKKNWKTIGALMENDKGQYMMIDRTFNPAGVPVEDGRSSIMVSLFEPKTNDQEKATSPSLRPAKQKPSSQIDDDIPF